MELELNQEGSSAVESVPVAPEGEQKSLGNEQPPVIDLDSAPKWKWGGKEWTSEEWKNSHLMNQDYTRKTQAIAEERKYYSNLEADLSAVRNNPSLAQEFMRIYPSKFHGYLQYVSKSEQKEAGTSQESNPDIKGLRDELNQIKQQQYEREVASHQAEIDSTFSRLGTKYPLAAKFESEILSRASTLVDRGEKMSPEIWDKLFKSVEDQVRKNYKEVYQKEVKDQTQANKQAKESPSGGAVPGRAPAKHRTIKEATDAAMEHFGFNQR